MSLNHIAIMGRAVKDAEPRFTSSGTKTASFTLAVDRDFQSKTSNQKEVDFIDVVCWRSTAEFAAKNVLKGRVVVADGRLQARKWKDKDGNNRTAYEIVANNVYIANWGKTDQRQEVPANTADMDSLPDYEVLENDGELPF